MFTCLRCRNPFNEALGNCPICKKAVPVAEIIPDAVPEATPEIEATPEPAPKQSKKSKKK